jgi:hypothetical protein
MTLLGSWSGSLFVLDVSSDLRNSIFGENLWRCGCKQYGFDDRYKLWNFQDYKIFKDPVLRL